MVKMVWIFIKSNKIVTSLKRSSLRCWRRKSIFLTATCLPDVFSKAMQTTPVEPSPIFMKLSRFTRGSPGLTTICSAARNCSWVNLCCCCCCSCAAAAAAAAATTAAVDLATTALLLLFSVFWFWSGPLLLLITALLDGGRGWGLILGGRGPGPGVGVALGGGCCGYLLGCWGWAVDGCCWDGWWGCPLFRFICWSCWLGGRYALFMGGCGVVGLLGSGECDCDEADETEWGAEEWCDGGCNKWGGFIGEGPGPLFGPWPFV